MIGLKTLLSTGIGNDEYNTAKNLLLTIGDIYQLQFNQINMLKVTANSENSKFRNKCFEDMTETQQCKTQKRVIGRGFSWKTTSHKGLCGIWFSF